MGYWLLASGQNLKDCEGPLLGALFRCGLRLYAVFDRLGAFPGGSSLFEPGLQSGSVGGLNAGSRATRTLAAIWSALRPAAKSVISDARILPANSADRGDTWVRSAAEVN